MGFDGIDVQHFSPGMRVLCPDLMRSALTVSLVPEAQGGPFVLWHGLADAFARASEMGFDAVEVFPPSADGLDRGELRALVKRHSLRVAAVGTGGGWVNRKLSLTHPDAAMRAAARAFVSDMIDVAAEFGAPAIIGSMQGRWEGPVGRSQAIDWLGDALVQLGERAGRHGTALLYEPLNRYETNLFNRIGDAASWLRSLDARPVQILADLFHMNIEEASIADALREVGERVGHVHFADSNRCAVGFGHTDVAPIITALREIGYAGYLSAEILPWPDSVGAARQTMTAFRRHVPTR
jgi:sugar phosphate isomerase/epimerase